ncbi:peptidase S9 family protein [Gordonia effusa NBRC 100432]|uniref:Peptidase S9 family protein n=1 Tax=Gordonia effusa NBRC 100432 TaxID=1077974 RepID=H0QXJ3_9ACTN|nr:prolyl oligopeptidase family serine peptidase [Gordonia effusa]GAB17544.1 peptidase S9 family protein [Gordonia effusa NBRC 100432]
MTDTDHDPYLWLEDVTGDEALAWVRAHNEPTVDALTGTARFAELQDQTLAILDSDDRIPYAARRGAYLYNFWRDAKNPKGLWRRTTLESYQSDTPEWDVIVDVDELSRVEDENWVWHGGTILRSTLTPGDNPDEQYRHALVSLSRGGADATVIREFDLVTRTWIDPADGGFTLPENKSRVSWIDEDTIYVGTDFGEQPDGTSSLTDSGYPRIVKKWVRGTPLTEAPIVFSGATTDVAVNASYDDTPGHERHFASRATDFYNSELYEIRGGENILIDVPTDAAASIRLNWLFVLARSPWELADVTYQTGTLVVFDYLKFLDGNRDGTVLFTPDAHTSLADFSFTRSHLILTTLHDVQTQLEIRTLGDWTPVELTGLPPVATISVLGVDPDVSDEIFLNTSTFTLPSTLLHGDTSVGSVSPIKQAPEQYDATGVTVDQRFATSADGTSVPYFVVRRADIESGPTLLYGYGGFENALVPSYSSVSGRNWVQRGGTYVIANIRGGGEYGPEWHTQAVKAGRHKVYEDFAAVAAELVRDGVTTVEQLGAQGGSNGGLLMGVMLTRYPELFGALVCQVPLIDMRRYHKLLAGASWMAEYGDPDNPDEWEFIRPFSPYQNISADVDYPEILVTTSTRDDRVHPAHARKLVARLEETGHKPHYYENIEGGHGGAADNKQAAFMSALAYEFLWETLTSAN